MWSVLPQGLSEGRPRAHGGGVLPVQEPQSQTAPAGGPAQQKTGHGQKQLSFAVERLVQSQQDLVTTMTKVMNDDALYRRTVALEVIYFSSKKHKMKQADVVDEL